MPNNEDEINYEADFEDMKYEEIVGKIDSYEQDINQTLEKLATPEDLSLDDWYEVLEKNEDYQEKLDGTLLKAMSRGIDKFDFDFLQGKEDIDEHDISNKILNKEIDPDDPELDMVLEEGDKESLKEFCNYVQKVERAGQKMEEIKNKIREQKGLFAEQGRKVYRSKEEDGLVGIHNDHYEASIASIMEMMNDKLNKKGGVGYEEAEEAFKFYEQQKEEKGKDLPPLTIGMLAETVEDRELRNKCLLSAEALTTEIKDASDLAQTYEMINAVENPDNPLDLKTSAIGAGAIGGLIFMSAIAGGAAQLEDTELGWENGPVVNQYQDMGTNITGSASQGSLNITGTVQGGGGNVTLTPVELGGNLALEGPEGNLFINETTGQVEFGTGNVSQIINETDGKFSLNETEGILEIQEGELEGEWKQVEESQVEGEVEEIDLDIEAESKGERKETSSLIPRIAASIGLGAAFGVGYNKLNKMDQREDEDLAEFVTRKYIASKEINEAAEEAFKDFAEEMKKWEKKNGAEKYSELSDEHFELGEDFEEEIG